MRRMENSMSSPFTLILYPPLISHAFREIPMLNERGWYCPTLRAPPRMPPVVSGEVIAWLIAF